jgi:ethanolamine transporter EutH
MKNLYIVLSIVVVFVFVGIWIQSQAINNGKMHFNEFNSAVIDSQIHSIRIAYKGTGMKLVNGREFVFYPVTNKDLNEGKKFNSTAEKGDYVLKSAFSDTLFLFHGNKKLAYTFKKFN